MRKLAIMAIMAVFVSGCQQTTITNGCGVIRDSLSSVVATTPAGQQRLDVHYERGKAARCW